MTTLAPSSDFTGASRTEAQAKTAYDNLRTCVAELFGTDSTVADLSAHGKIKFPATQSASSDANTLDDYEEGTATMSIGDGSTTVSLGSQYYLKVGRMVMVFISAYDKNISGLTTARLRFSGLPFTSHAGSDQMTHFVPTGSSGMPCIAYISTSATVANIYKNNGTGANLSDFTKSDFTDETHTSYYATLIYLAAA
jgi:hypothetical protein